MAELVQPFPRAGIDVLPEEDEPAVVPGAIVAHVGREEAFGVGEFGVPEREAADEPLAVGPDVVVLGVFGEHLGEEGEFGGGDAVEAGHEGLAVMPMATQGSAQLAGFRRVCGVFFNLPDLVVFEVLQGKVVEPLEFLEDIVLQIRSVRLLELEYRVRSV